MNYDLYATDVTGDAIPDGPSFHASEFGWVVLQSIIDESGELPQSDLDAIMTHDGHHVDVAQTNAIALYIELWLALHPDQIYDLDMPPYFDIRTGQEVEVGKYATDPTLQIRSGYAIHRKRIRVFRGFLLQAAEFGGFEVC